MDLKPIVIHAPTRKTGIRRLPVDLVVVHFTVGRGSAVRTATHMRDSKRSASANYYIGDAGEIVESVPPTLRANHAGEHGKTKFPDIAQLRKLDFIAAADVPRRPGKLNTRSIGIELCNWGPREDGEFGKHRNPLVRSTRWQPYSEKQYQALFELVRELRTEFKDLKYATGHEDVSNAVVFGAPGAKLDPGPLFDWQRFVDETGLVFWGMDYAREGWVRNGHLQAVTSAAEVESLMCIDPDV